MQRSRQRHRTHPTPPRGRRRSGWRLLSLLAVPLIALAGCGGGEAADGKVTIRFTYLWTGPEGKAMEKIIADFNASQDRIVVKGVSNPDQQSQIAAMSSANGTFDISDNFGANVGSWASKSIIEPLDSYIAKDKLDVGDFVPAAMDQMRYDGKTYALPIAVHSTQLMYNKKLFAEAGITAPKTTSEWAAAIAKLTKVQNGQLTQLGLAAPDLTTLGWVFGGGWVDKDGKPTPDNPGNVAAAQFYVDNVVKRYGVDAVSKFTSGFGEYASPQNPFYQGKVAMTLDGEWQAAFIKQYAPELDWGVVPIPHPDDKPELANTTSVGVSTMFIPRNSKHKQQAWEFMKYLLDKEAMLSFTHTLANLPARTSLIDDAIYNDLPQFPVWGAALKSKNATAMPSLPYTQQYTADLNTAFDVITRAKKSPQDALAEVAEKAKKYDTK